MIGTLAAARRRSAGGSPAQFTGVTYTASTLYSGITAPDYTGMNDGSASGAAGQTGTGGFEGDNVKADLGSTKSVDHVVIGYDYLDNLPNGPWGYIYLDNVYFEGSTNNTDWTLIQMTPNYTSTGSSDGLVTLSVGASYRYLRVRENINSYVAITEFQIWGT